MPSTETHFDLTADGGCTVEAHRWQGPAQRAILQLEDAPTQAGYVVHDNEHRGHGKGASARGELGN